MWVVVLDETFYPNVLYFKEEQNAIKRYDEIVEYYKTENDLNVDNIFIAKITEMDLHDGVTVEDDKYITIKGGYIND